MERTTWSSVSVQYSWWCWAKCSSWCLILVDPVSLPQMSKDSAQSALLSGSLTSIHRAGPSQPRRLPFLQVQSSSHSLPVALGDPCHLARGGAWPRLRLPGPRGENRLCLRVRVLCPTRDRNAAKQWVEVTVSRPSFHLPQLTAQIQNKKPLS